MNFWVSYGKGSLREGQNDELGSYELSRGLPCGLLWEYIGVVKCTCESLWEYSMSLWEYMGMVGKVEPMWVIIQFLTLYSSIYTALSVLVPYLQLKLHRGGG